MVLGKIRLRLEELIIFFLGDRWVTLLHFRQRRHFANNRPVSAPQRISMCLGIHTLRRIAALATPLSAILLADFHGIHMLCHVIPVERLKSELSRVIVLVIHPGPLRLVQSRNWMNHDIVVDMWRFFTSGFDVLHLIVEFLLKG